MTSKICFHDINDCYCIDVVRLWNEIKDSKNYEHIYDFLYHSHNCKLMRIGLLELNKVIATPSIRNNHLAICYQSS